MKKAILAASLALGAALYGGPQENVYSLSWGDMVGDHQGDPRFAGALRVDRPEDMKTLADAWKARGITKILFRVDDWRYLQFMDLYMPDGGGYETYRKAMTAAWKSNVPAAAVAALKAAGIKVYMWISIVDEGCPPSVMYADTVPWPWQSKFFKEHPEYQSCDRSPTENGRKYHWGIPEFAYPEVRAHLLSEITFFSDKFDFDGVFLSFRSHSPPTEYADQFGFNAPVVEEYQKRYGKNILRQDFDVEKWRELRGEYFTQFLREVHDHVAAHHQAIAIGVAQGEHIGPPFGNMQIQWKTWVKDHLIDELVIGHHTMTRSIYSHRWQLTWGYVQDENEGIGLPPIEEALNKDYGPYCQQYGVKLYVTNFRHIFPDPTMGKSAETAADKARWQASLEKVPYISGVIHGGLSAILPPANSPDHVETE